MSSSSLPASGGGIKRLDAHSLAGTKQRTDSSLLAKRPPSSARRRCPFLLGYVSEIRHSVDDDHAYIANVGVRGAGFDQAAGGFEKVVCVVPVEIRAGVELLFDSRLGDTPIDNGSRCIGRAVFAIRPAAQ